MWEIEVSHKGLHKYRIIRGKDKYVVDQKAEAQVRQWEEMWKRRQKAEAARQHAAGSLQLASERTAKVQEEIKALESILIHTLDVDDTVDWDALKDRSSFTKPQPQPDRHPPEPNSQDYRPNFKLNLWDWLIQSRREKKIKAKAAEFERDHDRWQRKVTDAKAKFENELNPHSPYRTPRVLV